LTTAIKTTAIFLQSFELASFNETLPAGEYDVETLVPDPADGIEPQNWIASVLVHLHPRASHPGLARVLTVPLAELERAIAKDKLTGKALTDFFLEEMLADPMIRLFMQADGATEAEVRGLYAGQGYKPSAGDGAPGMVGSLPAIAGHDGLSPRWGSPRPGIGE
jgi:hypothetical protein